MRGIVLGLAAVACFAGASSAVAQVSPSAFTTGYRYDALRRLVGEIKPDPDGAGSDLAYAAIRNTYDAAGRLTRVEKGELASWQSEAVAPSAWSGFTIFQTQDIAYDAMDRKVKETLSSAGTPQTVTQYSYDLSGRLECTALRMNAAVFGSLPASACTLGTEGSFGPDRITKNVYDAAGQLIQIRKAVGTSLEQAYATYSYTLNGQQDYVIDANGNRAKLTYDGFDRQTGWYFPSTTPPSAYNGATQATALASAGAASTTDYEQYGYDANGNRTFLRKRDGQTIAYTYDALNRMTVKDLPGTAGDVSYTYDLRGLQLTATFTATGRGVTNVYDGFGRQTSSTSTMSGTSRTLSYQYDANGNRTRVIWPDNLVTTFTYDGLDRMSGIYEGDGTAVVMLTYAYDVRGQRSAANRRYGANSGYGYDGASRLQTLSDDLAGSTQDVTSTFDYNPASQIITRTRNNDAYAFTDNYNITRAYGVNGLNQYTAAGPATFTYDQNGNLTSDGSVTFGYDVENRLVSASGAKTASLTYDPMGRLFQTSGGSAGTTQFLYDGDALVEEYDGSGNLLRRYVHGPGIDEPVIWYEGAGLNQPRWLHADHQGSVMALSNYLAAAIAINTYDPYGIPGSANLGRFQYTGQIMIPELGFYHYKARIYSPTLGRFLQTDPIGYDDQINLYAYVGNDPVNMRDPDGQCGTRIEGSIGPGCSGASIMNLMATLDGVNSAANASPSKGNLLMPQGNGIPRGGDTMATHQAENDDVRAAQGDLTPEQLAERRQARADGALTGISVVEGGLVAKGAAKALTALKGVSRSDVIRWGPTVVSNQILRGAGEKGAGIRWTVKGGGGPFSWKYHIGSYNWYKPWTWFKQTPIIKP